MVPSLSNTKRRTNNMNHRLGNFTATIFVLLSVLDDRAFATASTTTGVQDQQRKNTAEGETRSLTFLSNLNPFHSSTASDEPPEAAAVHAAVAPSTSVFILMDSKSDKTEMISNYGRLESPSSVSALNLPDGDLPGFEILQEDDGKLLIRDTYNRTAWESGISGGDDQYWSKLQGDCHIYTKNDEDTKVWSCETQKYNPLNPDNLCDTPSDAGHCILGLEGNCTHGLSLVIYKVAHLDVTQLIEKTWDVPLTYTCPSSPTTSPTNSPTVSPTKSPTASPTKSPTVSPTKSPTASPTKSPTVSPTKSPTGSPTKSPTGSPTKSPTGSPTKSPTGSPTESPTGSPTKSPTASTTTIPPTTPPSSLPSYSPSSKPSTSPSSLPSFAPTEESTEIDDLCGTQACKTSDDCTGSCACCVDLMGTKQCQSDGVCIPGETAVPSIGPTETPESDGAITTAPTDDDCGNTTEVPTRAPVIPATTLPRTREPSASPSVSPTEEDCSCTQAGRDVYDNAMSHSGTPTKIECCQGLNECFANWNHDNRWYTLCLEEECPASDSTPCSVQDADPFRNGPDAKIECCEGLNECLGDWNTNGISSYLCLSECPDTPAPTPSPTEPSCTGEGLDPYSTGTEIECCDQLDQCLGDWNSNGIPSYLCMSECPDTPAPTPSPTEPSCTVEGGDPYSTGTEIECCDQLQACNGYWSGSAFAYYICMDSCPPEPNCTALGADPFDNANETFIPCCGDYESCLGPWSSDGNNTRYHFLCLEKCPSNSPTVTPTLAADVASIAPSAEGDCLIDVSFDCHACTDNNLQCEDFPRPEMSCSECDNNELTFTYNNRSCAQSENDQGQLFDCEDKPGCTREDEVRVTCVNNEEVFCNCTVNEGEIVKVFSQIQLPDMMTCTVTNVNDGESCQEFEFDPSGGTPIMLKDTFGSLTLEGCKDNSDNNNQCLVNADFKYLVENKGNKNVVISEWTRTCSDGDYREFVMDMDALAFEGQDTILLHPNTSIYVIEPTIIDVCRTADLVKTIYVEGETPQGHSCSSQVDATIPAPSTPIPSQVPSASPTVAPSVGIEQAQTWNPTIANFDTGDDRSEAPTAIVPDEAQMDPRTESNCTGINECPYLPVWRECCPGLELCEDDWYGNGIWFFKCVSPDTCHKGTPSPVPATGNANLDERPPNNIPTPSPTICTEGGQDPWDNDTKALIVCCDGFKECLGPWSRGENGETRWHYLCLGTVQGKCPEIPVEEAVADTTTDTQQTQSPTKTPTVQPTPSPTKTPTVQPTLSPSESPADNQVAATTPPPAPVTAEIKNGKKGKGGKGGHSDTVQMDPLQALAQPASSGKKGKGGSGKKGGKKGSASTRAVAPDNGDASPDGAEKPKVQRSFAPDVDQEESNRSSKTVLLAGICMSLAIVGAVAYRRRILQNSGYTTERLADNELNFAVGERDDDEDHEEVNLCDSPNCIICKYRCTPTNFLPPPSDKMDAIDEAIESRSSSSGSNNSWQILEDDIDSEMALGRIEV